MSEMHPSFSLANSRGRNLSRRTLSRLLDRGTVGHITVHAFV